MVGEQAGDVRPEVRKIEKGDVGQKGGRLWREMLGGREGDGEGRCRVEYIDKTALCPCISKSSSIALLLHYVTSMNYV